MTIHDILRALVSGAAEKLRDSQWITEALEVIDRHEAAQHTAAAAEQVKEAAQ